MSNAKPIIIEISSSSSDEEEDQEDDVPLIQLLRSKMKKNAAMKEENKKIKSSTNDSDDECMILENNPFESIDESTIQDDHKQEDDEEEDDVSILSEKGQVACRDFPHSRHLCVKFPFETTPHRSYCQQCYCYVCDSAAPCEFWLNASGGHCHAVEKGPGWDAMRKAARPTPKHC